MLLISGFQLHQILDFPSLVAALHDGFKNEISVPQRHHHAFNAGGTLLLMPAWVEGQYLGIKIITVLPKNRDLGLPTIRGTYDLFNAETGEAIAQLDAPVLTNYRTAATSALAASYLARKEVSRFLMIGTGSLAPFLIRAHLAVRSYSEVQVWGRNREKTMQLVESLNGELDLVPVEDLATAVRHADVISTATMAMDPLIPGDWLKPGAHLDLVGSYKPDMREADDSVIIKSRVYVDTLQALTESGDLAIPLSSGVLDKSNIVGTLPELVKGVITGRTNETEITLYKSVGHASQDLIAAVYAYENYGTHF